VKAQTKGNRATGSYAKASRNSKASVVMMRPKKAQKSVARKGAEGPKRKK
jgi:hypothetical protein